jgi:hypothetical protein
MIETSIKSIIWVKAQIRLCDINFLPIVVIRKGDPDAGTVLLKMNRIPIGIEVFNQTRTLQGEKAWACITGTILVSEEIANSQIEIQCKIDPDLWVLEIEDPHYNYNFEGPII